MSGLFLKLIYHGAGMVVHLLLLKFSMPVDNLINEASHTYWLDHSLSYYASTSVVLYDCRKSVYKIGTDQGT